MCMLPLLAAGLVVISLMISESGGTMLSDVVNQKDDDTCHPKDGSQCIELDSHSGETGCKVLVSIVTKSCCKNLEVDYM